jgi:thiosulfate/3-mercaptopyruvate sulfurtransferase
MITVETMRKITVWTFALCLMTATIAAAPGADAPEKLVATAWLQANLANENVRILDMRTDIRDYWLSHIPGAIYVDPALLRWPERGVPSKLMSVDALALLLGQMGITSKTMVVVYYDKNGYPPLYLVWALDYIGHQDCALLEDGIERWKREGRTLTQDYPEISPVEYRLPAKLHPEVRATLDEIPKDMKAGAILIDVRPEDFFSGDKGAWKRKGRIRGAISHFWAKDMNADGTWKPKEELLAAYQSQGITPDKTIIVYCGQGQMSAHTYFSLKHILGFPKIKLYDGGFNEWSNRDDLPVEPGK